MPLDAPVIITVLLSIHFAIINTPKQKFNLQDYTINIYFFQQFVVSFISRLKKNVRFSVSGGDILKSPVIFNGNSLIFISVDSEPDVFFDVDFIQFLSAKRFVTLYSRQSDIEMLIS
jgi:hypothetical protein